MTTVVTIINIYWIGTLGEGIVRYISVLEDAKSDLPTDLFLLFEYINWNGCLCNMAYWLNLLRASYCRFISVWSNFNTHQINLLVTTTWYRLPLPSCRYGQGISRLFISVSRSGCFYPRSSICIVSMLRSLISTIHNSIFLSLIRSIIIKHI
jgi:hypothetical protein